MLIGGFPLPSLTSMALGGLFRAAFRGLGALARAVGKTGPFSRLAALARNSSLGRRAAAAADDLARMRKPGQGNISLLRDYIRARRMVDRLVREGVLDVRGSPAYREAVMRDLYMTASSAAGRQVLDEIAGSPHTVVIQGWRPTRPGNAAGPNGPGAFQPGVGSGSTVYYEPNPPTPRPPGSPAHAGLTHELGHTAHNATGTNARNQPSPQPGYPHLEEYNTINHVDNANRAEWGLPQRTGHNHLP